MKILFPILFFSLNVKAQYSYQIKSIIDSSNIENAYIKFLNLKIISNKQGKFILPQQPTEKEFIYISHLAFSTFKSNKISNTNIIYLQPKINSTNNIVVTKPYGIILKAIRKIKENYWTEKIITEGILTINKFENDVKNKSYRNLIDSSILNVQYQNYNDEKTNNIVFLKQNKKTVLKNNLNKHDSTNLVNYHYLPSTLDYVKNKSNFLNRKFLNKYSIISTRIITFNNRKCYFISLTKGKYDSSNIIIDTSTFGIYKITNQLLNVKTIGFVSKEYIKREIVYDYFENKLILNSAVSISKLDFFKLDGMSLVKYNNILFNITDNTKNMYQVMPNQYDELIPIIYSTNIWDSTLTQMSKNHIDSSFSLINSLDYYNNLIIDSTMKVRPTNNKYKNLVEKFSIDLHLLFALKFGKEKVLFINPQGNDSLKSNKEISFEFGYEKELRNKYFIKFTTDFDFFKKSFFITKYNIGLKKYNHVYKNVFTKYYVPIIELSYSKYLYNKKSYFGLGSISFGLNYTQSFSKFSKKSWYIEALGNLKLFQQLNSTYEFKRYPINLAVGIRI